MHPRFLLHTECIQNFRILGESQVCAHFFQLRLFIKYALTFDPLSYVMCSERLDFLFLLFFGLGRLYLNQRNAETISVYQCHFNLEFCFDFLQCYIISTYENSCCMLFKKSDVVTVIYLIFGSFLFLIVLSIII